MQVERDPFSPLVGCDTGINQHQDPGLDDDTRRLAMKKVKHAVGRSVFFLDSMIQEVERRAASPSNRPKDMEWYKECAHNLMEEMLSHGSR